MDAYLPCVIRSLSVWVLPSEFIYFGWGIDLFMHVLFCLRSSFLFVIDDDRVTCHTRAYEISGDAGDT